MNLRESRGWGMLGGVEGGKAVVGVYCMKKYNKLFFNV